MRACAAMGIRQAFTSYSNPKGNADTERFLRTLKEELVWLREWTSPSAFFAAFDRWLSDYNASYLHSALGYRAPNSRRSRASRPRHSLSRGLLNGVQYSGGQITANGVELEFITLTEQRTVLTAHYADRQRYLGAAVVASGCRGHAEMSDGGLSEGTRPASARSLVTSSRARAVANPFTSQLMQILLRHAGKEPPGPGKPGIFALGGPSVLDRDSPDSGSHSGHCALLEPS